MGLKNNLELKGGLYPEALLIRCIFLFTGQEMSLHLDGLINGGVGAYRRIFADVIVYIFPHYHTT